MEKKAAILVPKMLEFVLKYINISMYFIILYFLNMQTTTLI